MSYAAVCFYVDAVLHMGSALPAGSLGWQALVERGLPHSALWDISKAILTLFGKPEVEGWTTDSMLTILEELTGILYQRFSHIAVSHIHRNTHSYRGPG